MCASRLDARRSLESQVEVWSRSSTADQQTQHNPETRIRNKSHKKSVFSFCFPPLFSNMYLSAALFFAKITDLDSVASAVIASSDLPLIRSNTYGLVWVQEKVFDWGFQEG
eukprot:644915-Amorphochlora_amoeboformis.AAC.1